MLNAVEKNPEECSAPSIDGAPTTCWVDLSLVGVLLTEVLGSLDHGGEGALDLIPLAGLETAVGVDPELLRADCLQLVHCSR